MCSAIVIPFCTNIALASCNTILPIAQKAPSTPTAQLCGPLCYAKDYVKNLRDENELYLKTLAGVAKQISPNSGPLKGESDFTNVVIINHMTDKKVILNGFTMQHGKFY